MKVNVWNTIRQLSKERKVDPGVIVNAIEESLRFISSKYFNYDENIHINFNPEKGELRIYTIKLISKNPQDSATEISLEEAKKIDAAAEPGNYIEIDLPSETLGRISAQAAKQVIFQKVSYAEQEKIYKEYAPRIGEILTGVMRRLESNQNMILEVDKTDVLLPFRETIPNEKFRRGDRIKAVIVQVLKEARGPQIIVSRKDARFLTKLLEIETPEIADGTIIIKDIIRQPGERSKVSIICNQKNIDPIGACIGVRGNRILSISKELRGEKIDVVEWSQDPVTYAKSALSPAKIDHAYILNRREKIIQVEVSRDQLSLAIGKKGLNVRLASKLVGWKIDIKRN
ncbi:transcription termination factor NusA [bacterium]|nr:transcription termination factor NusA [bacterium]